jgi:hypothetical protein
MGRSVSALSTLLLVCLTAPCADISLYVSPNGNDHESGRSRGKAFATIARARDEIRALKKSGRLISPVTVFLGGGLHLLNAPIVFNGEDSGTASAPITFTARGNDRPIISGGLLIKGWKRGTNGIWTTTIEDVKAGRWHFNQLYINGQLRRRARTPNEGFFSREGLSGGDRQDRQLP